MDTVILLIISFVIQGTILGIVLILYAKKLFTGMQKNMEKLIDKISDSVEQALVINQSVNKRIENLENKFKLLEK